MSLRDILNMDIQFFKGGPETSGADVIVCAFFEDHATKSSDELVKKFGLETAFKSLKFTSEYKKTAIIPAQNMTLIAVGLGKKDQATVEKFRVMYSKAYSEARSLNPSRMGYVLSNVMDEKTEAYEISYVSRITDYKFNHFKPDEPRDKVATVLVMSENDLSEQVKKGDVVGAGTNLTRDLANMPSSNGTPTYFEKTAKEIPGIKVTVLGRDDFIKLGMGGLEGVSRAAAEPGKLVIAEYKNSDEPPILLVGKGITFDSGGISIKPSQGLQEMKFDKCGASAVLGALKSISEMKLKTHVIGMMPLTENLPGGNAYKPGDILKHYNGKTSEIISTDAEGRLVLSDALAYGIEKFDPKFVVDLATLTGACVVALGNNIAGLMTNDPRMNEKLMKASESSWEKLWPLPLDEDFKEQIKSEVADIKNTGGRPGGSETAGAFLSNFVGEKPWAHLDIAGTAWTQEFTAKKDYISKGATGFGTRLLFELVSGESS